MLRSICWRFDSKPVIVEQGESRLGKFVAVCKDYWYVLTNVYKLADGAERKGYFHSVLGAKHCLYGTADGFEFRAYVDEDHDKEAKLVMAAMIGFIEESPNFATSHYKVTIKI